MPAEVRYVWRSLQLIFAVYAGLCTLVLEIPPSQFFIPNALLAVASAGLWAFFCLKHHVQEKSKNFEKTAQLLKNH